MSDLPASQYLLWLEMRLLDCPTESALEPIFASSLKNRNTLTKICLSKNFLQLFQVLLIVCITWMMLAWNMTLRRNYGSTCIWIAAMNILDGEMMANNTQRRTLRKRKRQCTDIIYSIILNIIYYNYYFKITFGLLWKITTSQNANAKICYQYRKKTNSFSYSLLNSKCLAYAKRKYDIV